MHFPVADLHCDLLSFMAKVPKADPFDTSQIACAFPWLRAGGVRAQVLAIYTDVHPESMVLASRQGDLFVKLLEDHPETVCRWDAAFQQNLETSEQLGIIASIENAAGIGTPTATWKEIYGQFDGLLEKVGSLAYISLTHHTENRFGGGNYTDGIGLKEDGKIGPITLSNAKAKGDSVVKDLLEAQKRFYESIGRNKPSQQKFVRGWKIRADGFAAKQILDDIDADYATGGLALAFDYNLSSISAPVAV
jgi:hypothetical protein